MGAPGHTTSEVAADAESSASYLGLRAPPEGWNMYSHDDHGQFYRNPLTGETMWPSFPGAPTLPKAPEGWEVHPHAEHGQYYYNPVTNETVWTRPVGEEVAPDLSEVLAFVFADADSNGDGKISTTELMRVLKRRAKGTTLGGNAHEGHHVQRGIFALKKLLMDQADNGEIGLEEWSSGLHAAIASDPKGAVAQWVLKELQEAADGANREEETRAATHIPTQFIEHHGGTAERDAAASREGEDVVAYTTWKAEFMEHSDEKGKVHAGASDEEIEEEAAVGTAASERGDADEECWYYETHGPFSLINLMHWRDSHELANNQPIRRGEGGASIELLEVLFDAGLDGDAWWYYDDSNDDLQHGPYTSGDIVKWLKAGHFEEHDLIHRGREGEPVEAGSIIE